MEIVEGLVDLRVRLPGLGVLYRRLLTMGSGGCGRLFSCMRLGIGLAIIVSLLGMIIFNIKTIIRFLIYRNT